MALYASACCSLVVAILLISLVGRASSDRDQTSCFYCVPDSTNNLCASVDKVTQQIDCPSGRCLVMGARLSGPGKVARMFTCDTHNIIEWGFQILRYPADKVDPNNCGWLETKDDEAITMLREYGLQGDVQKLLQGKLPSSGAEVSSVAESMEVCTCEGKLCNSPDAQIKWTLLPASGDSSNLQSRKSDFGTKNEFDRKEKEREPSSSRLKPRDGLFEKDRDSINNYMNNAERGGEKPPVMEKVYYRENNGQAHPPARLIEMRSGNPSPRKSGEGAWDGWWYWLLIILSILSVLGAMYLFYRVASSPIYATSGGYDQTIETRRRVHVEGVPLQRTDD